MYSLTNGFCIFTTFFFFKFTVYDDWDIASDIPEYQKKHYGDEKVIVLKGNHEQMFLEWIDDFRNPYTDGSENYMFLNDWLRTDYECGAKTIRSFLSEEQMLFIYLLLLFLLLER